MGKDIKTKNAALSQYYKRRLIRKELSSSNLKSELNLSCSTRIIRRTGKNTPHLKLKRRVSKKTLTKKHKSARLEFCRHNMQKKKEFGMIQRRKII